MPFVHSLIQNPLVEFKPTHFTVGVQTRLIQKLFLFSAMFFLDLTEERTVSELCNLRVFSRELMRYPFNMNWRFREPIEDQAALES